MCISGRKASSNLLGSLESKMANPKSKAHKHLQLNAAKLQRAQKLLHARTETETIELALDFIIAEHERNRLTAEANGRFVKSGCSIKDVYGVLEK
jgi:hypothetical protein